MNEVITEKDIHQLQHNMSIRYKSKSNLFEVHNIHDYLFLFVLVGVSHWELMLTEQRTEYGKRAILNAMDLEYIEV